MSKCMSQHVKTVLTYILKDWGMQYCEMPNGFTSTTNGFSTGDKLELPVCPPIQEMVLLLKTRNLINIKTRSTYREFLWQESMDHPGGNSYTIHRHLHHITARSCEMNLHSSLALINLSSWPETFQLTRGRLPGPSYTFRKSKQVPRRIPTTTQAMVKPKNPQ